MHISTICGRMHSKLCDELSSHAHAHANALTVEITSNANVICKAHMRVACVSVSGVGVGEVLLSGSFSMCPTVECILCSKNVYTAHSMKQLVVK